MKELKKQLIQLLNIQAPSGKEGKVVNYVKPILEKLTDKCWLDDYGNLLAEKKVGTGEGATIILSAHMDTVQNIQKGRKVIEKDGVFRSTKGVLGADDRAGIAIILAVLRNIGKTSFNGNIKVAFSREEEIGCVGASQIDPAWYKGSDLAIVVDRRGNRDIVTGCGNAFCSDAVGKFFEECGAMLDMDWVAKEGGISDAVVFSENGVNSVNLSAGYFNEHTEKETVHLAYMKDTVNLILQALALVNQFTHTFGEVPKENQWVKDRSKKPLTEFSCSDYEFSEEVLFEGEDTFGRVSAVIIDGYVSIQMSYNGKIEEVFLSQEVFEQIADAFYCSAMSTYRL